MKGAKVNEVDGVRFDIYGAGAVLFSVIEGSFPAHGGLSRITKRCPEALHWIVRRSMAEMNGRYSSAREMLLDVHAVLAADDPFVLKPADLPSLGGQKPAHLPPEPGPLREFRPDPAAAAIAASHYEAQPPLEPATPEPPSVQPLPPPSTRRGGGRFLRVVGFAAAVLLIAGAFFGLIAEQRGRERQVAFQDRIQAMQHEFFGDHDFDLAGLKSAVAGSDPARFDFSVVITEILEGTGPRQGGSAAARVLYLDDFSSVSKPESMARGAGLLDQLVAAGYETVSDHAGSVDEEQLNLLAGARAAIGLQSREQALQSLTAFLRAEGSLDGVVWIHEADEEGQPACSILVLGGDGMATELRDAVSGPGVIGRLSGQQSTGPVRYTYPSRR